MNDILTSFLGDFNARHAQVTLALSHVLDMNVYPGSKYWNHPIFIGLRSAQAYDQKGDIVNRDLELNKAGMLLKHLKAIAVSKPELFEIFKKQLRSRLDLSDYIGDRFEINIAHSLIKKEIDFTIPDRPDFLIPHHGVDVGLECTTTYSETTGKGILEIKINRAINKKSKKNYQSIHNLALLIDTTNTDYLSIGDGNVREKTLKQIVGKWESRKPFGSYIFFIYYAIERQPGIWHSCRRFDSKSATKELVSVLKGKLQPSVIRIPKVG